MTVLSLEGLLLTVACAVGWSLLDLSRKFLAGHASAVATALLLVVGQIPLFVAWIVIEGRPVAALVPSEAYWPAGVATIALNVLANLAFMQSVKLSPMSRTVPLLSLTPVFTTLVAIPVFGEWPTGLQAVGIVVVVVASMVIARGASEGVEGGVLSTLMKRGGLLMAGVALLWSITPNLDKLALEHATAGVHALILVTGCAVALAAVAVVQGRQAEVAALFRSPAALGLLAASVVAAAFSVGVQFLAYEHVAVGFVETVKRGIGAAFALFAGRVFFAEHIGLGRLVAAGIMVAGVGLVIFG
ncbi:MAG: EamA family transporter [Acidobacteriota bacterium]